MTNALPSAPTAAPAPPVDPRPCHDADPDDESFASLLDEQTAPPPMKETTAKREPGEVEILDDLPAEDDSAERRDEMDAKIIPVLAQIPLRHAPAFVPLGEHLLFSPEILNALNGPIERDDAEPVRPVDTTRTEPLRDESAAGHRQPAG